MMMILWLFACAEAKANILLEEGLVERWGVHILLLPIL